MNRETRRANGIRGPIEFPPGAFPNADQVRAARAASQGPPPQVVVNGGPLMNDIQLVAMVAASVPGPAVDAVKRAQDIVAHAIMTHDDFLKRLQELQKAPEEPTLATG